MAVLIMNFKRRHGKPTDKSDKHNSKVMSEVLRDYGHFGQWEMNLHIFNVQVGKKTEINKKKWCSRISINTECLFSLDSF